VLKLLAGLGDVESAAPSMAMWDLGRMVVDSPSLTALFDTGYRGLHSRVLGRSDDPDVAAFLERFADFTYHYGCRGPNEWETRSPTWETEPDLALAAIDRMRLSDPAASPHAHNADRAAEREALGDEIAAMLDGDPDTQAQFRAALHSATVFMPGRERTKTNCVKLIHEWRVAFHEFGRRRVADGTFNLHTDFGLLRRDELREAVADPGRFTDELRRREALLHEVAGLQEPFLFAITDPSWTPLFVPAAGVVVDVGAPLSHAIIVSRELGIPCVVSAIDATKRIPDGALVEVNGDTGVVTVLSLP
jgi:pyruvate,water dikinase